MSGPRLRITCLLGLGMLGLMLLSSSEAAKASVGPFQFPGEQTNMASQNDITEPPATSMTSQTGGKTNHVKGTETLEGTETTYPDNTDMNPNSTGASNDATTQSDEEKIKGRLGPHNTLMGTPSHSKGISFTDHEEHYKCYSCKGKACALTQTSQSTMCNTTRRACWMTFKMADGITRGCSSPTRSIKCTKTYPNGFITDGRCSFCCTDNLCNWHVLINSTCVDINAKSSAPAVLPIVPICLASIILQLIKYFLH